MLLVWVWAIPLALVALLGLTALVVWLGTERAIHPQPLEVLPEPAEYPSIQGHLEPVSFASRDGTRLAGWFLPLDGPAIGDSPHGPAIILAHGYASNKREMLPHAAMLRRGGYSLLLFDFRAQGDSGGRAVTLSYREAQDVLGALDYLQVQNGVDRERIGILGVSMGGAAAISAASVCPEIKAVAVEAAFSNLDEVISRGFRKFVKLPPFPLATLIVRLTEFRLGLRATDIAPVKQVGHISPRPILIMHGREDQLVDQQSSEILYREAGDPKELWLIPGLGHAHGALIVGAEYELRIRAFFDTHLKR